MKRIYSNGITNIKLISNDASSTCDDMTLAYFSAVLTTIGDIGVMHFSSVMSSRRNIIITKWLD